MAHRWLQNRKKNDVLRMQAPRCARRPRDALKISEMRATQPEPVASCAVEPIHMTQRAQTHTAIGMAIAKPGNALPDVAISRDDSAYKALRRTAPCAVQSLRNDWRANSASGMPISNMCESMQLDIQSKSRSAAVCAIEPIDGTTTYWLLR